jgi:hypothetical protein
MREGRVTLRAIADDDLAAVEAWWPEAAATVQGFTTPADTSELHDLIEASHATLVVALGNDPTPIGLLAYVLPAEGWLEFRFVALAAGRRGWGYGAEAVQAVEASGLAERFTADVHAANGLALYFWLRMGYRPASPAELTWREADPDDMISLIRRDTP